MAEKTPLTKINRTKYPESGLERRLIDEFLLTKGYRRRDLKKLPPEKAEALMREACTYAAVRLTHIEARSKLSGKIKAP